MHTSPRLTRKPTLLLSALLGGIIFTSCASAPQSTNQASSKIQSDQAPPSAETANSVSQNAPIPRSRPQLIKKAAITLIVNSVDQSVDAVSQIINKQQGDLINLKEQQPTKQTARHTASIQLRVPQNLLEPTLEELAKLGTVESRNITAEDVGDRLVDFQARLTNLRKTEANLQKIMDRAGSVRDGLNVAQELSNVRQSIEQIDAQVKNLQNQVAYSTITLNLEAAVSSTNPQRALGSQIQETWNNSTNSFGTFTVRLLKLGIWLMVYSPYLLILAAGVYGFTRWRRTHSPRLTQTSESANSD
jgi:vacuolar-type H+-ATPase subunit I/STV1